MSSESIGGKGWTEDFNWIEGTNVWIFYFNENPSKYSFSINNRKWKVFKHLPDHMYCAWILDIFRFCVCVWSHNPLCNNFCILVNNKTFHFKKYYEMKQYKINVSWYLHCKYRLKRNLTFFTSRKSSIIDTILNIWGIFSKYINLKKIR